MSGKITIDGTDYHYTYDKREHRIEDIWRDDGGEVPDNIYECCDHHAIQRLQNDADRMLAQREDAWDKEREDRWMAERAK